MLEFFSQFSEEGKLYILKTVMTTGAIILIAIVIFILTRKSKKFAQKMGKKYEQYKEKLEENEREIEQHTIDAQHITTFTRSDLHFWISQHMKKGCHCLVMTRDAAWNKNHDIRFPHTRKGQTLLYLCIYRSDSQEVVLRHFVIADSLEPELDSLLKEHNGSVDFEY